LTIGPALKIDQDKAVSHDACYLEPGLTAALCGYIYSTTGQLNKPEPVKISMGQIVNQFIISLFDSRTEWIPHHIQDKVSGARRV
jgi:hypothetical protein